MKTISKALIFLTCLLIAGESVFPQNPAAIFTYDAAGDRTKRIKDYAKISIPPKSEDLKDKKKIYRDALDEHDISIYPNPTLGNLTVRVTNLKKDTPASLSLYDMTGKLTIKRDVLKETNELDIGNLSNGTYIMKIMIGEKVSEWKIIKNN